MTEEEKSDSEVSSREPFSRAWRRPVPNVREEDLGPWSVYMREQAVTERICCSCNETIPLGQSVSFPNGGDDGVFNPRHYHRGCGWEREFAEKSTTPICGEPLILSIEGTQKTVPIPCVLAPGHDGEHSWSLFGNLIVLPELAEIALSEAYQRGKEAAREVADAEIARLQDAHYRHMSRVKAAAAAELRTYWLDKKCGAILNVPVLNNDLNTVEVPVACCLLSDHAGDHSWQFLADTMARKQAFAVRPGPEGTPTRLNAAPPPLFADPLTRAMTETEEKQIRREMEREARPRRDQEKVALETAKNAQEELRQIARDAKTLGIEVGNV